MVDVDWNPDRKKLKQFGLISLIGFAVIGTVLGFKFGWFEKGEWLIPMILWGIGCVSAVLAMIQPALLKPLYLLLTAISAVIGPIIATIIMGLIFLFVFAPLGLLFRIKGRDELHLHSDPDANSYWSEKPPSHEAERYFRQY